MENDRVFADKTLHRRRAQITMYEDILNECLRQAGIAERIKFEVGIKRSLVQ